MTTTKLTAAQAVANHLSTDPNNSHEITNQTISDKAWKTVRTTLNNMADAGHVIVSVTTDGKKRYMITEAGLAAYAPADDEPADQSIDESAVEPPAADDTESIETPAVETPAESIETPAEKTETPAVEIDPEKRAKMMAKIRKMLEVAELNKDASPYEAKQASENAARLMAQYHIADAEVRATAKDNTPQPIVDRTIEIFSTGGYAKERILALSQIAEAFGAVTVLYLPKRPSKWAPGHLTVMGTKSQVDAMAILIPSLLLQMENAARKTWENRRAGRVYGPNELSADRRRVLIAFMIGFGNGVADKVRSTISEEQSTGAAIVLASDFDRAMAKRDKTFPKLKNTKTSKIHDWDAFDAGRDAGQAADVADAGSRLPDADEPQRELLALEA